jgi:hypothetical protein
MGGIPISNLFNDAVSNFEWWWVMNWKGSGSKWPRHNLRYYLGVCLDRGKPRKICQDSGCLWSDFWVWEYESYASEQSLGMDVIIRRTADRRCWQSWGWATTVTCVQVKNTLIGVFETIEKWISVKLLSKWVSANERSGPKLALGPTENILYWQNQKICGMLEQNIVNHGQFVGKCLITVWFF